MDGGAPRGDRGVGLSPFLSDLLGLLGGVGVRVEVGLHLLVLGDERLEDPLRQQRPRAVLGLGGAGALGDDLLVLLNEALAAVAARAAAHAARAPLGALARLVPLLAAVVALLDALPLLPLAALAAPLAVLPRVGVGRDVV